jgi:hypothetical protein
VWLEAGDIVYVPVSPYKKIGEFADSVIRQFVRTVAVNGEFGLSTRMQAQSASVLEYGCVSRADPLNLVRVLIVGCGYVGLPLGASSSGKATRFWSASLLEAGADLMQPA